MAGLDFGQLNAGISQEKLTEPRKIFTTLNREPRFKRPSDEQSDILDAWFIRRNTQDNTVKMNTGGGKTLVGLLALQSSLNEGVGPAVYVCPDNFLTRQVLAEAKSLGIAATEDENNPDFIAGNAILVVNVFRLVNGKSVFGVGSEGIKIAIGSLVIDDAHACLATIADQFKIKVDNSHDLFSHLLDLFEPSLKEQSPSGVLDLKSQDPQAIMAVPFWAWQSKQEKVLETIYSLKEDDAIKWQWPLVRDILPLCKCVIAGDRLEINPPMVPIDVIPAFAAAKRRIYMTATLADDSILVSHFQANPDDVRAPIRPKGGGDIGDRMILAPQEINPNLSTDEIKRFVSSFARHYNVCVIVPSFKRAEYWKDVSAQQIDKKNIGAAVERMKSGHVGLSVLVNKYDGIDLPGSACELLLIDGLPEIYGLQDRIEMAALDGTRLQLVRQIQRIEQGMGRGVRSSEDHCVVLLLGARLTAKLRSPDAQAMFSSATLAQINLGKAVTKQVQNKSLTELVPIIRYCLDGDPSWKSTSRNAVVNAPPGAASRVDESVVQLRRAFDAARSQQYDKAAAETQKAVNAAADSRLKGYIKQNLAEYTNFYDEADAQEIQLSALQLNRRVLRPITGAVYTKLSPILAGQAENASQFLDRFEEPNDLLIWLNGLIEDLSWGIEGTKRFEIAMRELGLFLGFGSQRPEEDIGKGPDSLWSIGGHTYLVIECKSGASSPNAINKHDCNQLSGSVNWFRENYGMACACTPIMVHPRTYFEHQATPLPNTRIMDAERLDHLKKRLRAYTAALAGAQLTKSAIQIATQLKSQGLSGGMIADTISRPFT